MHRTKKMLLLFAVLIVILSSWYVYHVHSNNLYIVSVIRLGLKNHNVEAQTIDVSFNQFKQERTIKIIFRDEPKAVYFYHYSFKSNEAFQLPKYGGSIKNHPEKGKHFKFDIAP